MGQNTWKSLTHTELLGIKWYKHDQIWSIVDQWVALAKDPDLYETCGELVVTSLLHRAAVLSAGGKSRPPIGMASLFSGDSEHQSAVNPGESNYTEPSCYAYPLVNIQKAMENPPILNGKIHYFYGHFPLLC